ncbi:MAG TPA: ECF transporter S component [Candidatus Lokiarchaeia archaeon]|nr:ECF transporter S component [Candidatus Lokiarchaeia archaeon]
MTTSLQESSSKVIAFVSIFSALIVVFSLLSIPMPQPIAYLGMASIAVLMVGLLYRPKLALVICLIGGFLGELITDLAFGYGVIPVYLLGAIVARGIEGPLISILAGNGENKVRDFGAMLIGTAWEVFGYILIGWPLIYSYMTFGEVFIAYLWVVVDVIWVPVAYIIVIAVRRNYNILKLEELIYGKLREDVPESTTAQEVQEIGSE